VSGFTAFLKKEARESVRSGKLVILVSLFLLFGMMNPAIAKLTPWMLEMMSESLAENGMVITSVEVNALTSWTQFFKNIPMALIVFVLLYGGSFISEYQTGTLVLVLTKGLARYKVVMAKALWMALLWTGGYALCFYVTYVYNDFYWDNAIAEHLFPSVAFWYLFGLFVIAAVIFFSTLLYSYAGVLLMTGGTVLSTYLLGLFPKVKPYMPILLTDSAPLLVGAESVEAYLSAVIVTVAVTVAFFVLSIPVMNRRTL
jgi:ABC-2 type transport system permease protein